MGPDAIYAWFADAVVLSVRSLDWREGADEGILRAPMAADIKALIAGVAIWDSFRSWLLCAASVYPQIGR